jgi:hypothetical protein
VQKDRKTVLYAILLNVVLLPVCFAQTGRMSVQENRAEALKLVEKYTKALDSTASFISHYEKIGEYRGNFPASHPFHSRYGGKEFRYNMFGRGVYKFKENKGYYNHEYNWGYFNEDYKNLPEDRPMYRMWIRTKDLSYFHQVNKYGSPFDSARRRESTTETIVPPDCIVGISHLLGYVDTEERLDEVLREADHISVRDTGEIVRGSACFVIDAHTNYGQFSIWLDPEHGFHPAKITHEAQAGERLHHHIIPVGSIAAGYSDVLQFKRVDDIWVPVEANAGYHRTIGSPAYYMDEDVHYKRTRIVLNPDHDKLGSFADPIFEDPSNDPELKNGTRVRMELNDVQTEYTWQDGKLIPSIDGE